MSSSAERNDTSRATSRAPEWLRRSVHGLEGSSGLDSLSGALAPIAERLTGGRAGSVWRGDWLGHALHPLLTDFPLGCWLSASLLDLTGGKRSRRAARRLVGLGLLAVPPTVVAGLADWSTIDDSSARRVGAAHAAGNTIVATLYLLSWRARRREHHVSGIAFALAGGSLAWVTGYLGGHLSLARSVGSGPRGGLDETVDGAGGETRPGRNEAGGDLLDLDAASARLAVGREQVDAMVSDGLLVPRGERDGEPLFAEVDLVSVRLLGG